MTAIAAFAVARCVCSAAGCQDINVIGLATFRTHVNAHKSISTFVEIDVDSSDEAKYRISMIVEKAASQLEALGNSSRLKIYRALVRAGQKGIPVGQLQERVGIPSSTLSHHLKKLVDTGLASQERHATTLICRADYPSMQSLIGFLVDECCADEGCVAVNDVDEAAA